MHIGADVIPYLRGEVFSKGLAVAFEEEDEDRTLRSRLEWLEQLCTGKNVVHVGCVDHSPEVIEGKRARGRWLHERLCVTARRCYGVDLDATGIEYMRSKLGYEDVCAADLVKADCEEIQRSDWDYMVLGEVIEHIDDPIHFLRVLHRRYGRHVRAMLITAPNAFARENLRHARASIERINTDHRYWFTPFTLAKVAVRAGLQPRRFVMCGGEEIKPRAIVKNAVLRRYPLLRSNIAMIAECSAEVRTRS
jgi:hypothetical protein